MFGIKLHQLFSYHIDLKSGILIFSVLDLEGFGERNHALIACARFNDGNPSLHIGSFGQQIIATNSVDSKKVTV